MHPTLVGSIIIAALICFVWLCIAEDMSHHTCWQDGREIKIVNIGRDRWIAKYVGGIFPYNGERTIEEYHCFAGQDWWYDMIFETKQEAIDYVLCARKEWKREHEYIRASPETIPEEQNGGESYECIPCGP